MKLGWRKIMCKRTMAKFRHYRLIDVPEWIIIRLKEIGQLQRAMIKED